MLYEGHVSISALINTKQTRPGMSKTEKITLVIDVLGGFVICKNAHNQKMAFFIIAHNQAEWYNVRIIKE